MVHFHSACEPLHTLSTTCIFILEAKLCYLHWGVFRYLTRSLDVEVLPLEEERGESGVD